MSYLNRMYGGSKPQPPAENSNKNPNRVAGGLRGQGADHYNILGEDGMEREVPTRRYVQALEEKIKTQDARLSILEKKLRSINNDQRVLANHQRMANQSFKRTDDL